MKIWTWLKSDADMDMKVLLIIYGGGGALGMLILAIGLWLSGGAS